MNQDAIIDELLLAGEDDWVMLTQVSYLVRRQMPDATSSEVIESTTQTVESMHRQGLVEVGDVTEADGFTRWAVEPASASRRIRSEWEELGRPLQMGDICWLSTTALGDERARRIRAEREG